MESFLESINVVSKAAWFFIGYDYSNIVFWLKMAALFLSTLFVYVIVYSLRRTSQIHKSIRAFAKSQDAAVKSDKNAEEWKKILERGSALDENERKFAIIAADSLVDKILGLAGYGGENLGERLKKVEPSDLDSLNDLWEAHKVRNRIAHEADFKLTKEDSQLALSRYEKALKELEYI